MRLALADAGLRPSDIAQINAHGTSTPLNDAAEAAAVATVFGDDLPPMTSTKGVTGHALGAAGGIEAAAVLLSMQHRLIPATANTDRADLRSEDRPRDRRARLVGARPDDVEQLRLRRPQRHRHPRPGLDVPRPAAFGPGAGRDSPRAVRVDERQATVPAAVEPRGGRSRACTAADAHERPDEVPRLLGTLAGTVPPRAAWRSLRTRLRRRPSCRSQERRRCRRPAHAPARKRWRARTRDRRDRRLPSATARRAGPDELGRNLVVVARRRGSRAVVDGERVIVDAAVLADPLPHGRHASGPQRTPRSDVVIELSVPLEYGQVDTPPARTRSGRSASCCSTSSITSCGRTRRPIGDDDRRVGRRRPAALLRAARRASRHPPDRPRARLDASVRDQRQHRRPRARSARRRHRAQWRGADHRACRLRQDARAHRTGAAPRPPVGPAAGERSRWSRSTAARRSRWRAASPTSRGVQVRTLNSIALAIVNGVRPFAPQPRRWQTVTEPDVRRILGEMVQSPRRRNVDPLAPWIEALSAVRLGLRRADEVEDLFDGDVAGLAQVLPLYEAELERRGRGRLRRSDHARDLDAAHRSTRHEQQRNAPAASCSSTSSRTSRRRTCSSSVCSARPAGRCSASATTTRPSTATTAPTRAG